MKKTKKIKKVIIPLIIAILAIINGIFLKYNLKFEEKEINVYRAVKGRVANFVTGTETETDIVCTDNNLYNALKSELSSYIVTSNNSTKTITIATSDIANIKSIDLSNNGIIDLTGLENLTSLTSINLSRNNIINLSALDDLTNISVLNLDSNISISDFSVLSTKVNLKELYLANTGISNLSFIRNLIKIEILDISNNSISDLGYIGTLANIKNLDVSNNKSLTTITDIIKRTSLTTLNISSSGITSLEGIKALTNLKELNIGNLSVTNINPIFEENDDGNMYLSNLEKLDMRYTKNVAFSNLARFENLKQLYMQGNNISSISGITGLQNLEYINLEENNISDISPFVNWKTENGEQVIHMKSKVKEIVLKNNKITDISVMQYLDNVQYLDLSQNQIYDISAINTRTFSKGIYLQNQKVGFNVYDKKIDVNQYIILPNLLQESKNPNSIVYNENSTFETSGVTLNSEEIYQQYGCYNIIIDPAKTSTDVLTVKLKDGAASGSVITYKLTTSSSAIDSLLFVDPNLDSAIYNYLKTKAEEGDIKYLARVPKILNLLNSDITSIKTLDISNYNIEDLTGLASFSALTNLNISSNKFTNIDEIQYCTKLQTLNVANSKIQDNNSAIQKLIALTNLDLSNTGMTNLQSINALIDYWVSKKKSTLKELNISNNSLNDIEGIERVNTLEKLYVANNNIKDISKISTLVNLTTLNLANNKINNIDTLENITSIKSLTINNNEIVDISPISNISITELNFSGNKVNDISSLSGMTSLTDLYMDNNKIADISSVENLLIKNAFSVKQQKLISVIEKGTEGEVTIELPEIFKDAKVSTSKVYTSDVLQFENCSLTPDNQYVKVNVDTLGDKIARVVIPSGTAKSTAISIAAPLEGTIQYDINEKTNKDVIATISFNRANVTILNNDGKNTYVFKNNGEFEFKYVDEYGFEGSTVAKVDWIDKEAPTYDINQEIVETNKVLVTITANEEIQEVINWNIDTSNLKISKIYADDANEEVILKDLVGNETKVQVSVTVDKTAPVVTGVENGQTYNEPVTPIITDENLASVVLTKDNIQVEGFTSGTKLIEEGNYVLVAKDTFSNTTTVSFKIEEVILSDKIITNNYTVDESGFIIYKILPGTTVEQFKKNINVEMSYTIVDDEDNIISGKTMIGTGYGLELQNGKRYTLVVYGDLNGDADVNILDVARLQKIIVKTTTADDLAILASDLKNDSKIDIMDLAKLQKLVTGQNIF